MKISQNTSYLGYKATLNKYKKAEITFCILSARIE
jgi:hypothetical protein